MTDPRSELDPDAIVTALERHLPDAGPIRPLSVLGRGFRSVALETATGIVIRVGMSSDALEDYAKEWRIGPFLAAHLGGLVPEPRWYIQPCEDLPYGALGYKKLPGITPTWADDPGEVFAADLGSFMARMHRLPVDAARRAGVPEVNSYDRVLRAKDVVLPALERRVEPAALARIEAWWSDFDVDGRMQSSRRSVCHHDLWHNNLLRSKSGHLSGVLDIAHVEVGDPAHDFAAPSYFGAALMTVLKAAYRSAGGQFDSNDEHRAQRFYEAREFGGLAWAVEHNDARETEDAIQKILRGPIFKQP